MTRRAKSIALMMAALGLLQLVATATAWSWPNAGLFAVYSGMAVLSSWLQLRLAGSNSLPLSANVPVILLGILQLSLPEAVIVGVCGALGQGLSNRQTRSRWLQLASGVCMAASAIATAGFVYRSLIPASVHNPTLQLLAASMALFFANTFPVALASHGLDQPTLGHFWKESYSWLVPYYLVSAVIASAAFAAFTSGVSYQTFLLVAPLVYLVCRYYRVQKSSQEMREKSASSMAALHLRTIDCLALAVEAKDTLSTRGHLRRVRAYALGIGRDLGLKGEELDALQAGALLHDIGKLAVPEYILAKPGKLTPEEFAKMKVHPIVGAEIVEEVQFPYPVAPIVRAHHEKWDGSGYPFGLAGENIPLGARIISAVDTFDALASDRDYRRALPLDEAIQVVESESGKALDPRVVNSLSRLYRELEQIARSSEGAGPVLSTEVVVERGAAPGAGLDQWALADRLAGGDFETVIADARKEERLLNELMQDLNSSFDLNTILGRVERSLQALIPYEAMAVYLPEGDTLVAVYSGGELKTMISPELRAGEGLIGWVAQNEQAIVNGNPAVEKGLSGNAHNALKATLAVPLKRSRGLAGVLAFYRKSSDSFNTVHLCILDNVAPRISIAIENALLVEELQARCSMDLITGLPTLRSMMQALEIELTRSRRQSQSLALLLLSFSGLSSLPHSAADSEVNLGLREIARSLRACCRDYDHVARLGDDQFSLILPGMKADTLNRKIGDLRGLASQIFPDLIQSCAIRVEIGWALYPDDADTARLLMAVAEGRSRLRTHSPTEDLLALQASHAPQEAPEIAPPYRPSIRS